MPFVVLAQHVLYLQAASASGSLALCQAAAMPVATL